MDMDDELLTPVLDERHDRVGFERPWQPWRLVFVSFFAGPFGAAYLFGMNFKRLGQRQHVWWSVLLLCVLGIVLVGFATGAVAGASEEGLATGTGRDLRTVSRIVTVLAAAGMAFVQSKRFHIFQYGDGEEGPLIWHSLGAIALNWIVTLGLTMAAVALLTAS